MSIATVTDLSHEVRRLAIAGAALGCGDHRLQKLLPPLQAAGEKVPVFAQLAEKTEALLNAGKPDAAIALMELNTLISAVLKTQGRIGIDGAIVPSAIDDDNRSRKQTLTSREIEQLKLSLQDYGGNLRDLRRSYKRGSFSDVRLAEPAIAALQAHSVAVSDFAASHLLPPHGKAIIPLLVSALDPSTGKAAQRTLQAIYNCDTESGEILARQLLDPAAPQHFEINADNASKEVRSTALQLLSNNDSDKGLLHDHLKAKQKALRLSAMQTLLRHGDSEARDKLTLMLQGSDSKINEAIESLPDLSNDADRVFVLQRGDQYLQALRANKLSNTDAGKLIRIMALVQQSSAQQDSYNFLKETFCHAKKLQKICTAKNVAIVLDNLSYLIKACPQHGQPATDLATWLKFDPAETTIRTLQELGPADALRLFEHIDPKARNQGIYEAFKYEPDTNRLPPPEQWTNEWVELSLDNQLYDLTDYLMPALSSLVLSHILQKMKTVDQIELLFALTIDPACAKQLADKKFSFMNRNKAVYNKLLQAVVKADLAQATDCLEQLSHSCSKSAYTHHRLWLVECEQKLTEHLS